MTIAEIINTIPAHAFYIIWDNYDGTDNDKKFLNNPIGRAAAVKFYDALKAPFKKIVYETANGDVDLAVCTDKAFWAQFDM